NITKCCTEVCPEHIKITDNAIIPMKERVVDRKYDPLVWLGRKIFRRDQLAGSAGTADGGGSGSGSGSLAPSNTEGVTGDASGLAGSSARAPQVPAVGPDGRLPLTELTFDRAAAPS